MNVTGHDTDFALAWCDDTGTVWSDETSFVLLDQGGLDADHVLGGDALGDADGETDLGLHGVNDGLGGEGWRDVDDGGIGLDVGGGLGNRVENGQTKMLLASLLWSHTTDNISAVGQGTLSVEGTLFSGKTLHQKLQKLYSKLTSHSLTLVDLLIAILGRVAS